MTLHDLVIKGIETAGPDTAVEALALRLEEANVGSIIIEEDMRPIGLVTDRDLALRVLARGADPQSIEAQDVMTPEPVTITIDAGLLDVTRTMREHTVRRLPVVDDNDRLVGIITLDDVMSLLTRELVDLGNVIEAEAGLY
ncbi:MAG: CBS domain-containing protein [Salinirussus sp.]